MVSCVWQRGSKLQYTNAAPVDTERKAYWNQVLKVVSLHAIAMLLRGCSSPQREDNVTALSASCRQLPYTETPTRSYPRSTY